MGFRTSDLGHNIHHFDKQGQGPGLERRTKDYGEGFIPSSVCHFNTELLGC
ncbi:hypothetical protein AXF42_Ash007482 [Apostasia shenzhenica]|uniref:Uncharacterized protein n=1 Tax=Apostasia shenzhenica TaxID=1088818 RepID=A0A2I0A5K3_9ASPA|nr:hypothetical protein AXF42_Ash007482 [Apostasia shenzhenica]